MDVGSLIYYAVINALMGLGIILAIPLVSLLAIWLSCQLIKLIKN